MTHLRTAAILILVALALAGCRRRAPVAAPGEDGTTQTGMTASERARADSLAAERLRLERERGTMDEEATRVRGLLTEMVFFDYDSERLSPETEQKLRTKAEIMRENPGITLRVEGHADARGSTEYNLALAQRRAESVRDFMAGFGISADRISPISYGKERPRLEGESEDAYAQNRRAEFVVTGGDVAGSSARIR
ncbi:MAG: OmpA family protein [Gemmatimonadota bacterium]|jgi:peptidoglycan-associated lipoprotein|nr:OmpA family protein [Gemmatimonadota bacterium]